GGCVPNGVRIAKLGSDGWGQLARARSGLRKIDLPAAVRVSLPAVWDLDEVVAVPHLSHRQDRENSKALPVEEFAFVPVRPLSAATFHCAAGFP
ncbi:MAG: hypothetical protein OEO83_19695, partial [Alphaproteobacteria bacterium]|nr:hypothetical protein [Alphaproteobacteria bacterium]